MAKHYIITNREIAEFTANPGKNFMKVNGKEYIRTDGREEAIHNLRYGTVDFDPQKAKQLKDFSINIFPDITEEETKEDILENEQEPARKKLGSYKVFNDLHTKCMKAKTTMKNILVFVHGYNNDLEGAMKCLRNLHKAYVDDPDCPIEFIVMFTWPSMRKLLRYRNDVMDAQRTGYAMARSFLSLKQFFLSLYRDQRKAATKSAPEEDVMCGQKMHLLCHSMGNRVFESMLDSLDYIGESATSMFGEIVLVAADVDYDCFEKPKPMYKALDLGERVHIYYHKNDRALGISEKTKNAFNRLGRWGIKNSFNPPDDVFQYDVSDVHDEELDDFMENLVNHWYYMSNRLIIKDIKEVLKGNSSIFN